MPYNTSSKLRLICCDSFTSSMCVAGASPSSTIIERSKARASSRMRWGAMVRLMYYVYMVDALLQTSSDAAGRSLLR